MPTSPRTEIVNAAESKPNCPEHPKGRILAARRPGETRLQWICMDCGRRLGDAGPMDYSRDRLTLG